jgi:phosphatidylserine/phosphatidylglycerophosphate/cardiolipin synthase-like enzyme
MSSTTAFFQADQVLKVSDSDYYDFLVEKIRQSSKRVHAAIFIVDAFDDQLGYIKRVLEELRYAQWRGLDVKVVVGHSEKSMDIDVANRFSFKLLEEKGVPVRYSDPPDDYSYHSKYVVFDDEIVLAGSHNWSHLDIFESRETSAAVYSEDVATAFGEEFAELWETGLEELE